MALAGLNHKLAGHNLSANDIPGILISSIYVGVRFQPHRFDDFQKRVSSFLLSRQANQTLAAAGSSPSIAPVLLISDSCSFWRSAQDF